ncbi:NAD-aldehyde dehydrogenase [Melanogaster broomeanus]|nr:NAD-aldehyde dehydrogenase [Melanogaster broomeanus]
MLSRNAIAFIRHARGAGASVSASSRSLSTRASSILNALDIPLTSEIPGVYDGQWGGSGDILESLCPTTGEVLAHVKSASPRELHEALEKSKEAHLFLRKLPAPRRGEVLRQIREALAARRNVLGELVALEMGKIKTEGIGEVQEFVDICDYAVGLSRMMNGRVVASERPGHTILEVPNPLGVVGVLTAFNFPVAVYGCTPLCAIAVTKIIAGVLERNGIPGAVSTLVTGGKDVGEAVVESADVQLVSFTGSEALSRFGKTILELGGNNASIIMPDADLSMAVPAVFFGAVGTAGQRCTTTRRLYLHRDIAPHFLDALLKLYASVRVGDPLAESTLLGPLHTRAAVGIYSNAVQRLQVNGAQILTGGQRYDQEGLRQGNFWIGPEGSDTGIVNVNVGTSGAEIGAAFGGNKSGGDAWKQYVRWSACTINFSDTAPLAQGVEFST